MPKRTPTPPPSDDEPRYLTVVYPFPAHANMELVHDCAEFSRWLACIVGKEALIALFHKPSSPNMIIIEVSRDFGEWNTLLGEHRWSEVFKKCDPKEKERVSQIFWCQFNTGRQVQKYGWKRVYVEDRWFAQWRVPNGNVAHPYPPTHWCGVPVEDRTNAPLCRPLPVESFPPPKAETGRPPPVGSAAWAIAKQAPPTKIDPKNAWGRGPPALVLVPDQQTLSPPPSASSSGSKAGSVWGASRSPAIFAPLPVHAAPPGLPPLNTPYSSSSDSPSWTNTPGLTREVGSGSGSGSDNSSDIHGRIQTPPSASETSDMFVADGKLEDALGELSFHSPSLDGEDDNNLVHAVYDEQPVEASENLWADYNKAEEPQASDEIICPAHGKKLCPRGICKEYKRLKKAMEREKEAEVKAAEIFEKRNKQKSKGKNLEPKPSNKISYSIPRERPGLSISNKIARGATESPSAPASAPTRAKPAHLLRSTSVDVTADGAPPVRPARGRKMNSNPVITTIPEVKTKIRPKDSDAVSVAASSASGWGNVSRGPWGGSSVGAPSVRDEDDGNDDDDNMTVNGSEKGVGNKSWADQMEEEDDNHSVAASSASGWGTISNGPW